MTDLKVVMMGLGYIGLPTAALIASRGIKVQGIDVNQSVVDTINEGKIHIVEPALDGLVKHVVERGFLKASTTVDTEDVYLIAVPTPFKGDHEPDLKYVESATRMIIPNLKDGDLFIIESTSPVGTTDKMAKIIFEERPELKGKINIAYCPERVLPGKVIYELEHNDRVIGGLDEQSTKAAQDFYRHFVKGELHATNAKTAEMCKLVENSSRDVSIAFANELSMICDKAGINVWELIKLANHHPRVDILQPGTGVGGHCIPVDPYYMIQRAADVGVPAGLITAARAVNRSMPSHVAGVLGDLMWNAGVPAGEAKVLLLGWSYKAEVGDPRETPAEPLSETLISKGIKVGAWDPHLEANDFPDDVDVVTDLSNASGYDMVVLVTAHKACLSIDWETLAKQMRTPIVYDGRRVLDLDDLKSKGWDTFAVGRPV